MSREGWSLRDFAEGEGASDLNRSTYRLSAFLLVLVLLVGSGVYWAANATIEEVARAEGRVVPSGRARTLESLEGGIVREILVEEGDIVAAGQVLIRIDDTGASANLGELMAQEVALRARAHRLDAEAESTDKLDFSSSGIDPNSPLALREVALFDSRHASHFGQRAVLDAQVLQRAQEVDEVGAALTRVDESLALMDEEISLRESSGVVPRAQILPLERERIAKRQERDALQSQADQTRAALEEAKARLTELALLRRAEVSTERAEALNQLSVISESIKRASDVVVRANLRAPVNGVVSVLNVNTLGAIITPGEEVLRIVPGDDRLQVEARVRPEDIAFVRPELTASVKVTAFDFTIYGALEGKVTRVGADAEQDEATGQSYFPIIIETAESALTRGEETHEIRPGMVASVDILTGDRTVLDYLLKPFRKARLEALRER